MKAQKVFLGEFPDVFALLIRNVDRGIKQHSIFWTAWCLSLAVKQKKLQFQSSGEDENTLKNQIK